MKRKKRLLILAGVLAALCAGIVLEKTAVRHVDKVNTTDQEILTIVPENATAVTMTVGTDTLKLEKQENTWKDAEDADYPIDGEQVEKLLEKFKSVHASFIVEDVKDYSQYGLQTPTAAISIAEGDQTHEMQFGTFSTMDNKRYVMLEKGTVYLIDEDLETSLVTDRDTILKKDQLYAYDQVTAVDVALKADEEAVLAAAKKNEDADDETELLPRKNETLQIQYLPDEEHSYNKDAWEYYNVQDTSYQPVDTDLLTSWLNTLTGLTLDSYVTYNAAEEDISKYGLDDPTVKITVAGTMQDESSKAPASYTVAVSKQSDEEIYLRVDESKIIFKIDLETYNRLAKAGYNDLRSSSVVTMGWDKVKTVTVKTDSETYEVEVKHGNDQDSYTWKDKDIDLAAAVTKINELTVADFNMIGQEEKVKAALEKEPEVSLVFALDQQTCPELDIRMYQYDGDYCVVTLNGETLGLMSRSKMTDLREAAVSAALNVK